MIWLVVKHFITFTSKKRRKTTKLRRSFPLRIIASWFWNINGVIIIDSTVVNVRCVFFGLSIEKETCQFLEICQSFSVLSNANNESVFLNTLMFLNKSILCHLKRPEVYKLNQTKLLTFVVEKVKKNEKFCLATLQHAQYNDRWPFNGA